MVVSQRINSKVLYNSSRFRGLEVSPEPWTQNGKPLQPGLLVTSGWRVKFRMQQVHLNGSEVQSSGLVNVNKRKATLNPEYSGNLWTVTNYDCKTKRKKTNYSDLTPEQPYVVIGIEADDYRIINDNGRHYLYPHNLFELQDDYEPKDWITEIGEDGERYAYPPSLNKPGFFEDFFDGDEKAVSQFWRVLNQHLAITG